MEDNRIMDDCNFLFSAIIVHPDRTIPIDYRTELVQFPTTAEEIEKVYAQLGSYKPDNSTQPLEARCSVSYLYYLDNLTRKGLERGTYETLDELNYLAVLFQKMTPEEQQQWKAILRAEHNRYDNLKDIINLIGNLDCYHAYPDIVDYDALGWYYVEELEMLNVPEELKDFIDYNAVGESLAQKEHGEMTEYGYACPKADSYFHEYYDGNPAHIPPEYRVTSPDMLALVKAEKESTLEQEPAQQESVQQEDEWDMER